MRTRSKTNLHTASQQQDEQVEKPPAGPDARTRIKTQEAMLSCCDTRQKAMSAQTLMSRRFPKELLAAVLNEETIKPMEYRHLIRNPKYRNLWQSSYINDIGRLTQGMPGRVKGTDTILFIKKKDVPAHHWQDITYGRIVVSFRPTKDDPNRTGLTMGGDRIVYPGDCGTPTVNLLTFKLHKNSTISTKNALYMTIDINNFYLNTPMGRFKYMRLKLADLPNDVIKHYNLEDKSPQMGGSISRCARGCTSYHKQEC